MHERDRPGPHQDPPVEEPESASARRHRRGRPGAGPPPGARTLARTERRAEARRRGGTASSSAVANRPPPFVAPMACHGPAREEAASKKGHASRTETSQHALCIGARPCEDLKADRPPSPYGLGAERLKRSCVRSRPSVIRDRTASAAWPPGSRGPPRRGRPRAGARSPPGPVDPGGGRCRLGPAGSRGCGGPDRASAAHCDRCCRRRA